MDRGFRVSYRCWRTGGGRGVVAYSYDVASNEWSSSDSSVHSFGIDAPVPIEFACSAGSVVAFTPFYLSHIPATQRLRIDQPQPRGHPLARPRAQHRPHPTAPQPARLRAHGQRPRAAPPPTTPARARRVTLTHFG